MALWKPLSRARRRRIYDRPPAATLRVEYRNPPTASCVSRISPPLYCGSPYDLRLEDHGFDPLLGNNLRQVVRSRVPLSSSSKFGTGQWALMPMPCGWEGSRRSGVALAVLHRLHGLSTYELTANGRKMSSPPTLIIEYGTLYLLPQALFRNKTVPPIGHC